MTKQEKIREGIAEKLCLFDGFEWEWLKEQQRYKGAKDCEYYLRCTDSILQYEDSQGVGVVTCPLVGGDLTGCVIVKVEALIEEEI